MNQSYSVESMELLLQAVSFAADKHQHQRRKGNKQLPYVNHPIQVAKLLWEVGHVRDVVVLVSALMHDTLEDTNATPGEIQAIFGEAVLSIVQEVTDDKSLPKSIRKQLQLEHAAHASHHAKMIKLADKICNVYDLSHESPAGWPVERITEYMDWSEAVVAQIRGTNLMLEAEYDRVLAESRSILEESENNALP